MILHPFVGNVSYLDLVITQKMDGGTFVVLCLAFINVRYFTHSKFPIFFPFLV